jgi:hypothetical protein
MLQSILDKALLTLFCHLLHDLPRFDLPWGSTHKFCLHFLVPIPSMFTTQHNILLVKMWKFFTLNISILLMRESVRIQNFVLCFMFKCVSICILLSISLSSAASCVTHGTPTKSPYSVYRFVVTCLLTQHNKQRA